MVASNKQADAQLRQAELSRRGHVAELFNGAVGQLKDEKLEIRLGAILTLGQICMDFRDLSDPVIQLPSTYLKQEKIDYGETEAPADVGEIIRVITLMSQNPSERTNEPPRKN
ncbi:MAG: hypothetical protein L0Y60_06605 [Beijerinckiaceae bacterium]|nr:hypothetical protein [Beijerinckiaceae bacterium]